MDIITGLCFLAVAIAAAIGVIWLRHESRKEDWPPTDRLGQ